jgi:hypothetical protein
MTLNRIFHTSVESLAELHQLSALVFVLHLQPPETQPPPKRGSHAQGVLDKFIASLKEPPPS